MKITAKNTPYDWAANELTTPLWFFTAYEPTASAGGTVTLPLVSNSPTAPATVNAVDGGDARGLLDTAAGWFTLGLNNGTTYPGFDNYVWVPDTDATLLESLDLLLNRKKLVVSMRMQGTDNISTAAFQSQYFCVGSFGQLSRVGWEIDLATDGEVTLVIERGTAALLTTGLGVTAETSAEWRLTLIFDVAGNSITAIKDSDTPVVTSYTFPADWVNASDESAPNAFQTQAIGISIGNRHTGLVSGERVFLTNLSAACGQMADILVMDITGQTVDAATLQAALVDSKHGTLSRELSSVIA